jgi:hypothetical protein
MKRVLVLTVLAGCGDNHAAPPVPDAPPPDGHQPCPEQSDREGGQVMFEDLRLDTDLQAIFGLPPESLRVIAFFRTDQVPQSSPFPSPGVCTNLEATHAWPLDFGSMHTDVDVGKLLVTRESELEIPKLGPRTDVLGRPHEVFYQLVGGDASQLAFDATYSIAFDGAAAVAGGSFSNALYLPPKFDVVAPAVEDNGPLSASTPFTVRWSPAQATHLPPANTLVGGGILQMTWLADTAGVPTHLCFTAHSDGMFTIPASSLAEYKAVAAGRGQPTSKAVLVQQAMAWRLAQLPSTTECNRRRLDWVGMTTSAQLIDVN